MFASSIESADTIRPPRSAYLLIDSSDRIQVPNLAPEDILANDLPPLNDFTIFKRQPFLTGYFTRLAVTEVRFDYNTPNLNPYNNKIDVSIGVNDYTITVPTNFYTPTEFATELENQLNAIPGQTWTVVYDEDTYNFIIDNTSGNPWFFLPYPYNTVTQTYKGMYYRMNWAGGTGPGSAGDGITQAGEPFPSLRYTDYIDICSRQLTQYQKVKDNSTRENQTPAVLCRLYLANYTAEGVGKDPLNVSYWPGLGPAVVHRLYNVPKYSAWSPGQFIDQIDIQLRDDCGNLLYTVDTPQSGNNFQLTCHASET